MSRRPERPRVCVVEQAPGGKNGAIHFHIDDCSGRAESHDYHHVPSARGYDRRGLFPDFSGERRHTSVHLVGFIRRVAGRYFLGKTGLTPILKNGIIGVIQAAVALFSYVLLFKSYEKRKINELSAATFWKNALLGFLTGLTLQSLIILVIFLAGDYFILRINPVSFVLPGLIDSLTAG